MCSQSVFTCSGCFTAKYSDVTPDVFISIIQGRGLNIAEVLFFEGHCVAPTLVKHVGTYQILSLSGNSGKHLINRLLSCWHIKWLSYGVSYDILLGKKHKVKFEFSADVGILINSTIIKLEFFIVFLHTHTLFY